MSLASNTHLTVSHVFFQEAWKCYDCHLWMLCNDGSRLNGISCFLALYELATLTETQCEVKGHLTDNRPNSHSI